MLENNTSLVPGIYVMEDLTIKYYSFMVGDWMSPMSTWRLMDLKIPAANPRMSIVLHQMMIDYIQSEHTSLKKKKIAEPSSYVIQKVYRQVIEWEKLDRPQFGQHRIQFKKVKVYSQHMIKTWF